MKFVFLYERPRLYYFNYTIILQNRGARVQKPERRRRRRRRFLIRQTHIILYFLQKDSNRTVMSDRAKMK